MTRRALRYLLPLALSASPAALAQEVAPRPTPLADALATQVRILAANPRDLSALISAGMLSVKLADPAAALAFFARAQAILPGDPRIAAGRAGAMVLLERPGEALQLYQVAERAGLSMRPYLPERGLAYDLTGQPGHAQRDYRLALLDSRDDETVRRLALSLGVSGKRDEAMLLLDPLLRRTDRAAWRARACVLAIGGDAAGAERIATSMMPGGAALGPFLRRLQWLSLADRAFAVHFGSLTASAARQNDARLAPAVTPLPPEPAPLPPVTVAAGRAPGGPSLDRSSRGKQTVQLASRTPLPNPVGPPSRSGQVPTGTAAAAPAPARTSASAPARTPGPPRIASVTAKMEIFTPPPGAVVPQARLAAPVPMPFPAQPVRVTEVSTVPPAPVGPAPTASTPVAASKPSPPASMAVTAVSTPPPASSPRPRASALDAIVSGIAIPAEELEVRRSIPRVVPTVAKLQPRAATKPDPKKVKTDAVKADGARADAAKPDPKRAKPDPAKAAPARWWVQVAGGANAGDLGKDWKRLAARSPAAVRRTSAWTTPLRATNRLLAGPFKTQSEAAAFVNALARDGASAFAWQSDAGQVVTRLAAK